MGARYRRKYTVLRHWLFHKSTDGLVQLEIAEERPGIDLAPPDPVVLRRQPPVGAYAYRGQYFYPKNGYLLQSPRRRASI